MILDKVHVTARASREANRVGGPEAAAHCMAYIFTVANEKFSEAEHRLIDLDC